MPSKGEPKQFSEDGRDSRDWSHPNGMSLEEVDTDQSYEGTVTNVGTFGVFVDFGAEKDGLLKITIKLGRQLKPGMKLKGLTILSCNPSSGKVVLAVDQEQLPELPSTPIRTRSSGPRSEIVSGNPSIEKNTRQLAARTRSESLRGRRDTESGQGTVANASSAGTRRPKKPRDWAHPDGILLEDLQEGAVVDGRVTNVSVYGVFLDIGAVRDARLSVGAKIGRRFSVGDTVCGCMIDSIDINSGRLAVSLHDAEATVNELPPKERARPNTKANARSGDLAPSAKAKARARSADPEKIPKAKSKSTARPKEMANSQARASSAPMQRNVRHSRYEVGDVADGVVTRCTPQAVFVDIGAERDGVLKLPRDIAKQFMEGDEVTGMVVESLKSSTGTERITLSLDCPELQEMDEPKVLSTTVPRQGLPKLKIGDEVDGIVARITSQGIFVDIGAGRDGVLNVPKEIAKEIQVGDEVQGMVIQSLRTSSGIERITLSLESPELEETAATHRRQAPKAAEARIKAEAVSNMRGSFKVGDEAGGFVTRVTPPRVYINVGAGQDGVLELSQALAEQFQVGDEVHGMTVEAVHTSRGLDRIVLSLECPQLDESPVPEFLQSREATAKNTSKSKLNDGNSRSLTTATSTGVGKKGKFQSKSEVLERSRPASSR